MADARSVIQSFLHEICDVPASRPLEGGANLIDDLNVDSLALLDLTHALDQQFRVSLPVEEWLEAIRSGRAPTARYFTIDALADHITNLSPRDDGGR